MPKRLAILIVAVLTAGCSEPEAPPPESGAADPPVAQLPPDPFGPVPRHPPEVVRLMKLMPGIPADGSEQDILHYLGLRAEDVKYGNFSGVRCELIWDIAPGYRFFISFPPLPSG